MKDVTINYVFDVDGTLTPSRRSIDPEFAKWFLEWCKDKYVFLASGSDYPKTIEQLGEDICNAVDGVYSCGGNALYYKGQLMHSRSFELTERQREYLNYLLDASNYPVKTGQHIEERIGMVNFSILGRGGTFEQRQDYVEYDRGKRERATIARRVKTKFHDLDVLLGGETGIDIFPKGRNKGQIASSLKPFIFFGDRTMPGGNDYDICKDAESYYTVKTWEDTWKILKEMG